MDTTIKIIRNAVVANIVVLGLVGCASSPAPWTQGNDNPWGAKRSAEEQNTLPDELVADEPMLDPVLLSEPEPIVMLEPEPEPEPELIVEEVIAPVVMEDQTAEQEIMSMPASNYAVQVFAGSSTDSVENFKNSNSLDNLLTVATDRSGSIIYVLVDVYPDRSAANAAAVDLEARTGSKPWVRSLAGLQKIVAQ